MSVSVQQGFWCNVDVLFVGSTPQLSAPTRTSPPHSSPEPKTLSDNRRPCPPPPCLSTAIVAIVPKMQPTTPTIIAIRTWLGGGGCKATPKHTHTQHSVSIIRWSLKCDRNRPKLLVQSGVFRVFSRTGESALRFVSFAAWTKSTAGNTNAISVHVDDPVSASAMSRSYKHAAISLL